MTMERITQEEALRFLEGNHAGPHDNGAVVVVWQENGEFDWMMTDTKNARELAERVQGHAFHERVTTTYVPFEE